MIASAMSKSGDQFSLAVLRSHMRSFSFFGDPMDMALRKLLMEATLPKETQQIDRVIQGFADRYHECNPGIFASAGMLHISDLVSKEMLMSYQRRRISSHFH